MNYVKSFDISRTDITRITLKNLGHHIRWCTWRTDIRKGRDGTEKPVKLPVGRHQMEFKANDPSTWMSLDEAQKVLKILPKGAGLGIVLGELAGEVAGYTLIGVDFDTCLSDEGVLADWAAEILGALGAVYAETSPSGTGVKAFALARTDEVEAIRKALDIPRWWRAWKFGGGAIGAHAPGIEFVVGRRFFTVTGEGNEPLGVIGVGEAVRVAELALKWFGDGVGGRSRGAGGDVEVTDEMIRGVVLPDEHGLITSEEGVLLERLPRAKALWQQTFVMGDDKSGSALAFNLARELRKGGIEAEAGIAFMLKHEAVWEWVQRHGEWEGRRQIARAWWRSLSGSEKGVGEAGLIAGLRDMPVPAPAGAVVALSYDAATVRRLVEAAAPEDAARVFAGLVGVATLDALEREELIGLVAKKAKLAKGVIKQQIREVRAAAAQQATGAGAADVAGSDGVGWHALIQRNEAGDALCNLANAVTFLRWAPELKGAIRFEVMERRVFVGRRLAGSKLGAVGEGEGGSRVQLSDTDVSEIQEWMQRRGLVVIGRDTVQQAIDLVARENWYHAVQVYLEGLAWDGVRRLDTWLERGLGADSQPREYLSKIGRMFIMSMVYRIMRPGCQCDYMIVLEGEQGVLKTTACQILAGHWFSNSLPDLHGNQDVRLSMHMRGKWLIEVGELSSFRKTDMEKLKNFISRRTENYTPLHARNEVEEPRQCVFIGTTNEEEYLKDVTGARRFWPVKMNRADVEWLRANRDQMFAEAMVSFRNEEPYWPSAEFEAEYALNEQNQRFEVDLWEETIMEWLEKPGSNFGQKLPQIEKCTTKEIAIGALKMEIARHDFGVQKRIAGVMRRLKWKQKPSTRQWIRPKNDE